MKKVNVGRVTDFPVDGRMTLAIDEVEIGIFRLGDAFYAWENICPHTGGPVCLGKLMPRVEEVFGDDRASQGFRFSKTRSNIVCPWHAYEFDIATGLHHGHAAMRLRAAPLAIENGEIILTIDDVARRRFEFADARAIDG